MSSNLKNFNVKSGLSVGPQFIDVIDANGHATFNSHTSNTANISNSLVVTGTTTLGNIDNVSISGGVFGQVMVTDGEGNLSWGAVPATTISNGTSNVSIPLVNGPLSFSVGGTVGVLTVNRISSSIGSTLLPQANNTHSLGNAQFRWASTFSANVSSNTLFGLASANSNISFTTTGINFSANGSANIVAFTTAGSGAAQVTISDPDGAIFTITNSGSSRSLTLNPAQGINASGGGNLPLIAGDTNVTVAANSNITMSVSGTANVVTVSTSGITVTGKSSASEFFVFPSYTSTAIRAITGQVGWTAAVSDSSPGGKHAYWDTTNSRWSYVNDDSAV